MNFFGRMDTHCTEARSDVIDCFFAVELENGSKRIEESVFSEKMEKM